MLVKYLFFSGFSGRKRPALYNNPDMITRINEQAGANVTELVGNTPLLELPSISAEVPGVRILGKAEWYNPGGSVKDRPALWMIRDGEKSGALTPEKTILDATSGNTGIAYAWIGAALGYQVRLCMPKNASEERKRILRAYGVEVVLTDPGEGSDGAIREARRLYAEDPELYFYPDQYKNPANPRSHYESTAPEIWEQTEGEVTHFVAGLGTSGTFVGTSTRLKEYNPEVRHPDRRGLRDGQAPSLRGGDPGGYLRGGRGRDLPARRTRAGVWCDRHRSLRQRRQVPLRELLGGIGPCRSKSGRGTSGTFTTTPERLILKSARAP